MKRYAIALSMLLAVCVNLNAHVSTGPTYDRFHMALDTGYRWDKFYDRIVLFGADFGARAASQFEKGMNSYQLGATCFWNCFDEAYVRARGHYSWILSGDYIEGLISGDIQGNMKDVAVGMGYAFEMHPSWKLAPVIGWSYDQLDLVGTKLITANFAIGQLVSIEDIETLSTFHGPWLGLDFLFALPHFNLKFGYELHRAWWEEKRLLQGGDLGSLFGTTTGFSNVRTHNRIWGNLFQIEGTTLFYHNWTFGIGLTYQIWKGQNIGKHRRTSIPTPPLITNQYVTDIEWNSFSATLQLGRVF